MKFISKKRLVEANEEVIEEPTLNDRPNPIDSVHLNVPLFMRLLEYAKEDAKTDMDLHFVVENILRIYEGKHEAGEPVSFLSMDDYDDIVSVPESNTSQKEVEESLSGFDVDTNSPEDAYNFDIQGAIESKMSNTYASSLKDGDKWAYMFGLLSSEYKELLADYVELRQQIKSKPGANADFDED